MPKDEPKHTTTHTYEEEYHPSTHETKSETKSEVKPTDIPAHPEQQANPLTLVCQTCLDTMYPLPNSAIYWCPTCGAQRYYQVNQLTMGQP